MKYYLMGFALFGLGVAYTLVDSPLLGKPSTGFGLGKAACWIFPALLIAFASDGLAKGSLATKYGIRISAAKSPIFFIIANTFYLAIACFMFWSVRYMPSH